MKAKLDTWINFKTTKEQKAQIESQAALCEVSQSEFIREAIAYSIMARVLKHLRASQELRGIRKKTYNFALTKDEIEILITATSRVHDPVAFKLYDVFVRASESIEKGGEGK